VLVALGQDGITDRKIGKLSPYIPLTVESFVHLSPDLDRTVCGYWSMEGGGFFLENGAEETRPVKWVGWKLPENRSVLLAWTSDEKKDRKLLVGGAEDASHGSVWDACLLEKGRELCVVVKTEKGMVLRRGDRTIGPHPLIFFCGVAGGEPVCYVDTGKKKLIRAGDREHEAGGPPLRIFCAPKGGGIAWVEQLAEGKLRPVVNGRPGPACDTVQGDILFSPNGKHAAYVTRDGETFAGWIDGKRIESEQSVVAAAVFDDGTPVCVEMWPDESPAAEENEIRSPLGRIVAGTKAEEKVLRRPVYRFSFHGGTLFGVSQRRDVSTIVRVTPGGKVEYEEVRGRVERIRFAPAGKGRIFAVRTEDGLFIDLNGRRSG
jgi:hypothetical protein